METVITVVTDPIRGATTDANQDFFNMAAVAVIKGIIFWLTA